MVTFKDPPLYTLKKSNHFILSAGTEEVPVATRAHAAAGRIENALLALPTIQGTLDVEVEVADGLAPDKMGWKVTFSQ